MRILVTGGGGFLGKALVQRLLGLSYRVRFLARSDHPDLSALGAQAVRGDIRDPVAVFRAAEGCDAVVHAAAKVGDGGRFADFYATNVTGTENVIAACRTRRVSRLVFTSSYSVVHGGDDLEGVDESQPYPKQFVAHYPHTKALAEQRVLAANDATLATVALRLHLVWGPGDTQLLPRAMAHARGGTLRFPLQAPKKIDSTYIDDAVNAHLLALERLAPGAKCAGKPYFITQGSPRVMTEFVTQVLAAVGIARPPVGPFTGNVMLGLGSAVEALYRLPGLSRFEPPLTRFVAQQVTTSHWFNISAARRELGYEPTVSIEEGLRRLASGWMHAR